MVRNQPATSAIVGRIRQPTGWDRRDILLAVVLGSKHSGRTGADYAVGCGMGLVLTAVGAAFYHLMTLDRQAELARAAHDTPGLGLWLVLVALAIALHLRRL
jgi:hypothetical protein